MRAVGAGVAVVLVAVGLYLWLGRTRAPAPARGKEVAVERASDPSAATRSVTPASDPAAIPAARSKAASGGRSEAEIELARRRRVELEAQIRAAQASRAAPAGAPSGNDSDEPALDRDYIRDRVREMTPLFRECYELALAQQQDLSGRLVVRFRILGEKELGGMVEKVEIVRTAGAGVDAAGDAVNAQLDECMQATVESLTFKAPKGGGHVDVTYPFLFASDGEPPK